ncbi:MAG: sulfite exporter TauE/SafE family protein [Acidobacteria bacterium]|nr:sulfite exporter TauE/SafE family protein [Acidobacteriota bacterium]MBU4253776.1 sulfite exporter TauE/SafE family protein [Acidobacteriota bacterium]
MDFQNLLLLFAIGAVAGFININAGGGSALTLPALIFLGLDGALANGTNRVAIFVQNIFAIASFNKNKVRAYTLSFKLSLLTLPGAVIGAIAATRISGPLFERILGVVLIFIVFSLFFSGSYKNVRTEESRSHWLIYPSLVFIGFYGGILQVGVGFLFMAALYHFLDQNLVRVNMHKVFIVLVYTLPALGVFILTGNINWKYGLALAGGNALGGYWGARAAVKGGEKFIRIILAVAILIMAGKLFDLY